LLHIHSKTLAYSEEEGGGLGVLAAFIAPASKDNKPKKTGRERICNVYTLQFRYNYGFIYKTK
jgi:hypothetical protein